MPLDRFIAAVELEIKKFLDHSSSFQGHYDKRETKESGMQKAAKLLCLAKNAKRIRTIIVYDFGQYLNVDHSRLIKMAASAELIHVASLLHDDVIDSGVTRRGIPTANVTHGNTIAVLAGDLLYSQALEFLGNTSMPVFRDAIRVVKEMTIAASMEYNHRGNINANIEDWMNIALGKTARLFSWCSQSSAILQNKSQKEIEIFGKAGEFLGLAFQLADDIKDFFAQASLGKKLYADIINQNTNYVLIQAMKDSSEIRQKISDFWSKGSAEDRSTNEAEKELHESEAKKIGDQILSTASFSNSLKQLESWINDAIHILKDNEFDSLGESVKNLINLVLHSVSPEVRSQVGVGQFKLSS